MSARLPVRAATVLASALVLSAAAAAPGLAAGTRPQTAAVPASGTATSSLTLLRVTDGSSWLETLATALHATTAGTDTASATVDPVDSSTGTMLGAVTVTPSDSPLAVGGQTLGLGDGTDVTSPLADVVTSTGNASSLASVTTAVLGTASLLGLPLGISSGTLSADASVTATGASASKSLTIDAVSLPSIGQLLTDADLDLSDLTVAQLTALANVLGTSIGTLATTLATDEAAITDKLLSTATETTVLATANADLATANTAFTTLFSAIPPLLIDAGLAAIGKSAPFTAADFLALSPALQLVFSIAADFNSTINSVLGDITTDTADALAATTSLALLATLQSDLTTALNQSPLADLSDITMTSTASASADPVATAVASIGGVDVLGTALLSSADLAGALAAVTTPLATLLDSLASGVSFTPPSITLPTTTHSTSSADGVDSATASMTALTVTLPSLTLPSSLQPLARTSHVTGTHAAVLHPHTGALAGQTLAIGTLSDTATYTEAVAATTTPTPTTSTTATTTATTGASATTTTTTATGSTTATKPVATLAFTGGTAAPVIAGLALLAAAGVLFGLRRRGSHQH